MDRSVPQRVLPTDTSDEASGVGRQGRAAKLPPRLPVPQQANADSATGLWREDDRRAEQGSELPVEANEDQTICRLQPGSDRCCPFQDDELLPEIDDLGFTPCRRATPPGQQSHYKSQNLNHSGASLLS
jgi:hypothetical protein